MSNFVVVVLFYNYAIVTQMGYFLPIVCRGICSNLEEDEVRDYLDPIMEDLAEAYLQILEKQKGKRKEFFGLRDFYRYACCHLVHAQLLQLITDEQCCLQWG